MQKEQPRNEGFILDETPSKLTSSLLKLANEGSEFAKEVLANAAKNLDKERSKKRTPTS